MLRMLYHSVERLPKVRNHVHSFKHIIDYKTGRISINLKKFSSLPTHSKKSVQHYKSATSQQIIYLLANFPEKFKRNCT